MFLNCSICKKHFFAIFRTNNSHSAFIVSESCFTAFIKIRLFYSSSIWIILTRCNSFYNIWMISYGFNCLYFLIIIYMYNFSNTSCGISSLWIWATYMRSNIVNHTSSRREVIRIICTSGFKTIPPVFIIWLWWLGFFSFKILFGFS